jgi:uncharacterized protein involved in copper resistance
MRIGRTIVAVLVALAVATLPAATGFAAGATTAMEISASPAMPDCDHHHHHNAPGGKMQKSVDDCASMAGCALKCFNFTGTILADIAYSSSASAALKPVRTNGNISSLMDSLPFRPPRA